MMPTIQKSSLVVSDEHANLSAQLNALDKNVSAESNGDSLSSSTNLTCRSSDSNPNSEKILSDLTNNNIIDSLAKNSTQKDRESRDAYNGKSLNSSGNRDEVFKDENEEKVKDHPRNVRECLDTFKSIDTSGPNRDSQLNNLSAVIDCQKSKQKKYSIKNQDSSSSNGSLGGMLKAHQIKEWKYSKTHQKRFKRRFPSIEPDEQLIDWFSCALIADILLQGYLYISQNYFAFYSNIFGYKTHVLINVSDVYAITKEKTAKIFPNAVGIHTKNDKFVFGSLLSRENTFKLLNEVRSSYLDLNKERQTTTDLSEDDLIDNVENLSIDQNDSLNDNLHINDKHSHDLEHHKLDHHMFDSLRRHRRSSSLKLTKETIEDCDLVLSRRSSKLLNNSNKFDMNYFLLKLTALKGIVFRLDLKASKSSFLILGIAFLILILLISISILLVRINSAHDKLISMSKYSHLMTPNVDLFNEMYRVMEVMKRNLNEISRLKSKLN